MTGKAQDQILSIEEWQKMHHTKPSVHAGAMALAGWVWGKEVSEAAYREAISEFLGHPKEDLNA